MDSLTQAVLGAAVGEATLGRHAGRRAAAWGAFLGTLPDLDIVVAPFTSEAFALTFHRGPTHALVFAFAVAPVFGWLLGRLHGRKTDTTWRQWAWLAFWAVFTHPLLDAFTAYGTQNFWPFTRYPVAISSISIIDPLYTLPLLLGLLAALATRNGRRRRRWFNAVGIGLSSVYLLLTLANKIYIDRIFLDALEEQGIADARLFTAPTLFNTLLWSALADDGETIWYALYSHLDEDRRITFRPIPQHRERLAGLMDDETMQVIFWFTQGYYTVREDGDDLIVADLHVGRADSWLDDDAPSVFEFRLIRDPARPDRLLGFEQANPLAARDPATFARFRRRILGDRTP